MKQTWILVADSSRARIFKAEKGSSIHQIEELSHPEGRLHEQELASDLPGKDSDKVGAGKHAFQDQVEPKQQEAIDFAKRIARHIDESYSAKEFEQLMVIAAPSFLGTLRHQFSDQINQKICFELDKNITMHSTDDIRKHLPKHFPSL
jgi:protein required for attachment to host cells